jgi:hypothetical protein
VPGPTGPQGATGPQGPTGPQGIIAEAPVNGTLYGRKDAGWVAAGGGTAASIAFTPAGNIAANNVQAALQEVDSEKVAIAGGTMTGLLVLSADPGAALGAATRQYADSKAAIPATATPLIASGSGAVGAGTKYAREDHVHPDAGGGFAVGTVMLFYQASAPVGWTKLTTHTDKALRVVSGAGGGSGGTNPFSTVMAQTVVGNTTMSVSTMAAHGHGPNYLLSYGGGVGLWWGVAGGDFLIYYGAPPSDNGSSAPHNHGITMGIQYIDIILASKN